MKELEEKKVDKPAMVKQVEVETKAVINSWKHHPGHRVWELNIAEGLIREAEVDRSTVEVKDIGVVKKLKVVKKDGCIYCSALNANNADKRFMKMLAVHAIIKKM